MPRQRVDGELARQGDVSIAMIRLYAPEEVRGLGISRPCRSPVCMEGDTSIIARNLSRQSTRFETDLVLASASKLLLLLSLDADALPFSVQPSTRRAAAILKWLKLLRRGRTPFVCS